VINGDQIRGEVTIAQATANWTAKRVVTSARKR
jgi:hypothetical protein